MTEAKTYSSAIEHADNYTRWILDGFRPYLGECLLEVGLGHGGYRPFLAELEQYIGVDIDDDAIVQAERRYPGDAFIRGDVSDRALIPQLRGRGIDTVLCANVLEHIPDDRTAIEVLVEALEPHGHLLLFVPAFPFLYGSLDELAGHQRRYTVDSLKNLLPSAGVRIVTARYFNSIGAVGWWLNGRIGHQSLDSGAVNSQIRLFDRFIVPLARSVDPICNRFFGQSLTLIAQKIP